MNIFFIPQCIWDRLEQHLALDSAIKQTNNCVEKKKKITAEKNVLKASYRLNMNNMIIHIKFISQFPLNRELMS